MKFRFSFVLGFVLALAGCAGTQATRPHAAAAKTPPPPATPPREVIIFIPLTDQAAQNWPKLFDRYPQLRMVIAMSPRFARFAKEPALKDKILALQKANHLELALQLPNPPFLPLLINSGSAKAALPPGTPLPAPSFMHPEDATQIVAKAKAEFVSTWGSAPKGFILPQGAVNADTLKLVNQLGFAWVVGALGAPTSEGAYRSGSLLVLDATPIHENPHFTVDVWDERLSGNSVQSMQLLAKWGQNLSKNDVIATLPSDPELQAQDLPTGQAGLPTNTPWGNRTWTTPDWSAWIGSAHKNAAWSWLRRTRDALEGFKNSGQASVHRLDMAFEEIYNAENANYFSGITEGATTFSIAEEREREFKATLSSVYRLIGQTPPDDLFNTEGTSFTPGTQRSSTTVSWETLPDGRGHLMIDDAANDDHGDGKLVDPLGPKAIPGTYDLRRMEIWVSSETLDWTVTLGSLTGTNLGNFQTPGPLIDIYMDLNGQPNVGTVSLLPGRGATTSPSDAWEYAVSLWGSQAQFYRTSGPETYQLAETVPLTFEPNKVRFSLPRAWLRGNPQRWGYQLLVMSYDQKSVENDVRPLITPDMKIAHRLPIYDLIDPLDTPQAQLLTDIEEGKRNDIPFVRLPASK